MAPKGKAAAKKQPAVTEPARRQKRKMGESDGILKLTPEPSSDDAGAAAGTAPASPQTWSQPSEAGSAGPGESAEEGKLPPIPQSERTKISKLTSYRGGQILADYKKKPRAFYWQTYRLDPKLSTYQGIDQRSDLQETATATTTGWMLACKVAELNGVLPGHPSYQALEDALVAELESKDHWSEAMRSKGFKLYYYEHKPDMQTVTNKASQGWTFQQKAEMKKQAFQRAIGNSDPSAPVADVNDEPGEGESRVHVVLNKWQSELIKVQTKYQKLDTTVQGTCQQLSKLTVQLNALADQSTDSHMPLTKRKEMQKWMHDNNGSFKTVVEDWTQLGGHIEAELNNSGTNEELKEFSEQFDIEFKSAKDAIKQASRIIKHATDFIKDCNKLKATSNGPSFTKREPSSASKAEPRSELRDTD